MDTRAKRTGAVRKKPSAIQLVAANSTRCEMTGPMWPPKLGLRDRVQAVILAYEAGFVSR